MGNRLLSVKIDTKSFYNKTGIQARAGNGMKKILWTMHYLKK
jgi:hypothetical protein